ncbi:sugar ABC transporter ATP-binding protein [Ruminococcus gauvreauii]|uniref:sugar ABC transporter ATP-binding protein n=1 Tax=Ruminococcus gauvreauii TaxID=438033 RepID=UPI0039841029
MKDNILLEMKNITKEFPGVRALDSVSFTAEKGEILALVGENGAGKSTLMKVLSGAYPCHSYDGEILINGKKMEFTTTLDSEKAGIAMIFQEISMHLDLTVAENLLLGTLPRSRGPFISKRKMFDLAQDALNQIHLDVDSHELLRVMNTSQMQLICIARALYKKPSILVLDEPTSALTETESKQLFKILHDLKKQGITSILISHKLDEVFANADRVTVLRDGKVISTHEVGKIGRSAIIRDMVGRSMDQFYPERHAVIGDTVLKAEHFSVGHPTTPERYIVKDVSFEVRKGEILGFAGLVGAGRSELMNAVFGKWRKAEGRLYIDHQEVEIKEPIDAVRHGLAMVTENRKEDGMIGVLNIGRNICLASLPKLSSYGFMKKSEEQKNAETYFRALDIRAPGIYTEIRTLSGGNQQKVILGKWMLTAPKVLILDEPTKGIDIAAKNAIYELMTKLSEQGMAIIMISSEMPELVSMSDRIVVLAGGRKTGELSGDEISQVNIMELATKGL